MALRRAVENGNAEDVKALLGKGVDVNERLVGGYTVLHYATTVAVAKLLINANADPEAKSFAGTTPLQLAQRRGNNALVQVLRSAEVPEELRRARLEVKRADAHERLRKALANRGIPDVATIESLPEEVLAELRRDDALQALLVKACAVQEFEALLGMTTSAGLALHERLLRAVDEDSIPDTQIAIQDGADLLQRDPHGNIPAHFCKSLGCFKLLVETDYRVALVPNNEGETPMELLLQRCATPDVIAELWYGGPLCDSIPKILKQGDPQAEEVPQTVLGLLQLNEHGVSDAMRHQKLMEPHMKPWSDFQQNFKMVDKLPECLAGDVGVLWPEHLAFALFGEPEVWKDGKMSAQCAERLIDIWAVLKTLLKRVSTRTNEAEATKALHALRCILMATKGPRKLDDPRESYRGELELEMQKLLAQSERILDIHHGMLQGDAATWLRAFPDTMTTDQYDPYGVLRLDPYQQDRPTPKLRHDVDRADGGPSLMVPSWLHADLDIGDVLKDLKRVGGKDLANCFGDAVSEKDAAYRTLATKYGFGPDSFPSEVAESGCTPWIIFWYAAWMRGLCQSRIESINRRLLTTMGLADALPPQSGGTEGMIVQSQAKDLAHVCEMAMDEIQDVFYDLLMEAKSEEEALRLMRDSPAFVTDCISVTFVASDPSGISNACRLFQSSPGGVVRVSNGYHMRAGSDDGYRDLRIWVPVKADKHGPIIVEVVMVLADIYGERQWQLLPVEYYKGNFDHTKPEKPHEKTDVQLPPHLVPQPKLVIPDGADEETERKMRELMEKKAKEEADRLAQEEARRKREEVERKLREEMPEFDEADIELRAGGSLRIRPPIEILPKTKRSERIQMEKVDKWSQKKTQQNAADQNLGGHNDADQNPGGDNDAEVNDAEDEGGEHEAEEDE